MQAIPAHRDNSDNMLMYQPQDDYHVGPETVAALPTEEHHNQQTQQHFDQAPTDTTYVSPWAFSNEYSPYIPRQPVYENHQNQHEDLYIRINTTYMETMPTYNNGLQLQNNQCVEAHSYLTPPPTPTATSESPFSIRKISNTSAGTASQSSTPPESPDSSYGVSLFTCGFCEKSFVKVTWLCIVESWITHATIAVEALNEPTIYADMKEFIQESNHSDAKNVDADSQGQIMHQGINAVQISATRKESQPFTVIQIKKDDDPRLSPALKPYSSHHQHYLNMQLQQAEHDYTHAPVINILSPYQYPLSSWHAHYQYQQSIAMLYHRPIYSNYHYVADGQYGARINSPISEAASSDVSVASFTTLRDDEPQQQQPLYDYTSYPSPPRSVSCDMREQLTISTIVNPRVLEGGMSSPVDEEVNKVDAEGDIEGDEEDEEDEDEEVVVKKSVKISKRKRRRSDGRTVSLDCPHCEKSFSK
ncbi:hypothetical protein SmJEL517_g04119 [Synchytrium microbalum]|uniref:Uncharacterized protein n=1 Tax=Synchytrium microbalum TaxID=1806994 RepID=A0A507C3X4_9FUNG|nr:uncharacterized protein SmJEL517_g04119 [Synchytrium microbalum]TPX32814.1 hypothetical protein SmJEL517_g04119 [Synchytrium microbalum]